jgi:TonB family protein
MVKVALYMIAFYFVYSIMLSRDTSYGRNRAFILLSLGAALLFPLITLQTIKPLNIQFFGKFLSEVFITANPDGTKVIKSASEGANLLKTIYSIYNIGVIVFIIKLSVDLLNLLFLIIRHKNEGSRIIRFHGFNTAGFSAMGYIFINTTLSPEEAGDIVRHEQNHLKQNHFIDIIFIELVKSFQWFNPVVYLFNRSLRAIHEYQADQECISSGMPVMNYQSLLLNQVFRSSAFNLTNSFSNPSLIRKRMIMMTKKRTSALASMKMLIVIPVLATVFLAISASKSESMLPPPPPPPPQATGLNDNIKIEMNESVDDSGPSPFVVVEEMPKFPGGDLALLKYIGENTNYPEIAKENNIQGKVIIRFCVTEKGSISRISVLKGIDPELDDEAIRVVKTLPTFKPGRQGGKPVPVWYMVPITFSLK